MNLICLRPLEEIDQEILDELKRRLEEVFVCPVQMKPQITNLTCAYNPSRKQYLSITLLRNASPVEGERVLQIVDVDLYAPGLNFVFGEADMSSGMAILSLFRLSPERRGLPPNRELFLDRAAKEAVHELGHTYGLGHCQNAKCIMCFSNNLMDTDRKQAAFCNKCRHILERKK